jgi:hypothetical protein
MPFEQLGRESPPSIDGTRPIALSARRPFALLGAQGLRRFGFEHLLQRRPHRRPQEFLIPATRAFTSIVPDLTFLPVMVCILAKGSGDCDVTRIP